MSDGDQTEQKGVEERWPHMPASQKWVLFGGLCLYAVLVAYAPLLFGWEAGRWEHATIEALTYVLFGAVLVWIVFPSVTDWIQHGAN